jgi:hypothetical protein
MQQSLSGWYAAGPCNHRQAGQPRIFVAAADGSDEHPLLPNPDADYDAVSSRTGRSIVFTSERNGSANLFRDCVYISHKSYSGLSPVVDSLLGISTEAVFLLTRNCSSKFRALICLMKDRFFRSLLPASQTVLEKPDDMNENLLLDTQFCLWPPASRPKSAFHVFASDP